MEDFVRGGINFIDISFLQNHIKDQFIKGKKCEDDLRITFRYLKDNFDRRVVDTLLEYLENSEADCDCKVMKLQRYIQMPNSEKVFSPSEITEQNTSEKH
ncbi:MAG: hypothetical protein JEY94_10690 [Melioribacteraceae bacterium]|nr:hypothetical protein [Melioribacteraceae bacterium]